jgi:hypothetical protein
MLQPRPLQRRDRRTGTAQPGNHTCTLCSSGVGVHFQLPILGRLGTTRHRKALQAITAGNEHGDLLARTIVRQACKYRKIKGPFPPPARATLSPTLRHWKPPPSCSAVRAPREAAWQAARRPLRAAGAGSQAQTARRQGWFKRLELALQRG